MLAGAGVSEEELEAELQERLADAERMQLQDDGVSAVLLLSAQAELGRMREAAAGAAAAAPPAEVWLQAAVTSPTALAPFMRIQGVGIQEVFNAGSSRVHTQTHCQVGVSSYR